MYNEDVEVLSKLCREFFPSLEFFNKYEAPSEHTVEAFVCNGGARGTMTL